MKLLPTNRLSLLGLIIWSLCAIFFLYEFFLRTFVGSVAHQIIPALGLNPETFSMLGSIYYITYAVMQIPAGMLIDKFGVKIVLTFAIVICAVATFLFSQANGFISASLSRALMGFGSSFAFICLLAVVVAWFPRSHFGFFSGASQFFGTLGPLLAGGPLIALMTIYHKDWRSMLSFIGAFGMLLAIVVALVVKNKPQHNKQKLIYLTPTHSKKYLLNLFRSRQAWCVAFYSATVYVSIELLGALWGTEYLQVNGLTQSMAASIISLAWLGYALGCPILGFISDIMQRRKPILVFCALLGFFAALSIVYLPISRSLWFCSMAFFCLGISASGQNIGFATMAENVDVSTRAASLGLNNGTIVLFSALVPSIVSYFIHQSCGSLSATGLKPEDFNIGFSILPILYFIALILSSISIRETYAKPQREALKLISSKLVA